MKLYIHTQDTMKYVQVHKRLIRLQYIPIGDGTAIAHSVAGGICAPEENCLLCELYKRASDDVARNGGASDQVLEAIRSEHCKDNLYEDCEPEETFIKCPRKIKN